AARRDQREARQRLGRRAPDADDGGRADGALRCARRVRADRRVPAVGRRVVHHRRERPGRRRAHQGNDLVSLARNVLLAMSTNAWLRERATKTAFVRRSVSAFMPGEELEDAMRAAAVQERQGVGTIFTKLGENVTRVEEAEEVTQHYLGVMDKVHAAGGRAQVSVKPTQLGLDLDKAMCFRNLQRLVDHAAARGHLVWIDMESSPYVDPTIDLFRRPRERSPLVGIALQAYLFRTAQDIEALLPLGSAIRLVKGAYLEPPSIAFPKKADVDEN